MTHASEPAWPVIETVPRDIGTDGNYTTIGDTYSYGGLTKREVAAIAAMQGILANAYWDPEQSRVAPCVHVAAMATAYADALLDGLAQLSKDTPA